MNEHEQKYFHSNWTKLNWTNNNVQLYSLMFTFSWTVLKNLNINMNERRQYFSHFELNANKHEQGIYAASWIEMFMNVQTAALIQRLLVEVSPWNSEKVFLSGNWVEIHFWLIRLWDYQLPTQSSLCGQWIMNECVIVFYLSHNLHTKNDYYVDVCAII